MAFASLALLALVLGAPANPPGYYDGGRALATRMAYPSGQADSVRRPGFNGREWVSRSSANVEAHYARDWAAPGPAAYGASEENGQLVYVRVGEVVLSINPWERQEGFERRHLEQARQDWLKEHGYIGGVRTFTNDAKPVQMTDASHKALPQPRATIQLSPEVTRFRARMQVQREPMKTDSVIRVTTKDQPAIASNSK